MPDRQIRVITPTDAVRVVVGAGDEYRYLATGKSTDGEYFLVEAIVPPGGGPPSHIQSREEEAFEGQLTFYGRDGEITAGPGTYLNIPKGAKHRFRNNTERPARMLFFFAPAGIEGLFDDFATLDQPNAEPAEALGALNTIGEKYGVQYFAD